MAGHLVGCPGCDCCRGAADFLRDLEDRMRDVVAALPRGKAVGEDLIPAELLQAGGGRNDPHVGEGV